MKKLIITVGVLFLAYTAFAYSYSMRCEVCKEAFQRDRTVTVKMAWRDFATPHKYFNGKAYATYRCESGHSFLVELGDSNGK